ncbi:MAG TPA: hypothetical protein DCW83_08810 [Saprospirales bacterium]|jgi:hypothetical protein|nr:hypothetical protein [Saprospirales bacterium]
MKRVRPNYIEVRIEQLKEELTRPNSEHDKNWYNRLIQELSWAHQMTSGQLTENCYMETPDKNMTDDEWSSFWAHLFNKEART